MRSSWRGLIAVLVITALCGMKNCSASSARNRAANLTQIKLEDSEDFSSLNQEEEKEEEETPRTGATGFRERYRRLIPYMTFYVSNNYVNPQSQSTPSLYQGRIPSNVQRRPQYSLTRVNGGGSNFGGNINGKSVNQYYVNPPIQHDKFIPSVQYDPADMDNEEFFTPVRYQNQKLNYDDNHQGSIQPQVYQRYETSRPVILAQGTTSASLRNEHQKFLHFTTVRPAAQTTIKLSQNYGDILARKPTPKPAASSPGFREGLTKNFAQRPAPKPLKYEDPQGYYTEELEPLRYAGPQLPQPFRPSKQPVVSRPTYPGANLNHIVKSLQLTNHLPEMLNADNIDDSIKTLVEILSLLNDGRKHAQTFRQPVTPATNYRESDSYEKRPFQGLSRPVLGQEQVSSTGTPPLNNGPYHVNIVDVGGEYLPKKIPTVVEQTEKTPVIVETGTAEDGYKIKEELVDDQVLQDPVMLAVPLMTTEEPALNYPPPNGATSHTQNFPPTSVKYGATRGKPNVDYPAYSTIPKTEFSCTTQRYKGFFGDPDTGCQVWHYCDLNGGKSSFLCPNGTIFSQVALTCDWWFNVKCESTTQLYVLNERLYKYILPQMPKFPEDFTGPEVDRYLELKFKEMEEKLKEKKLRKHQEELNKIKNNSQIDSGDIE